MYVYVYLYVTYLAAPGIQNGGAEHCNFKIESWNIIIGAKVGPKKKIALKYLELWGVVDLWKTFTFVSFCVYV